MNYWKLKIINNNLWLSYYENKISKIKSQNQIIYCSILENKDS